MMRRGKGSPVEQAALRLLDLERKAKLAEGRAERADDIARIAWRRLSQADARVQRARITVEKLRGAR